MSDLEIQDFLDQVDARLAEAQYNMLVEKALHNRSVVIADKNGNVVHASAKQLLNA